MVEVTLLLKKLHVNIDKVFWCILICKNYLQKFFVNANEFNCFVQPICMIHVLVCEVVNLSSDRFDVFYSQLGFILKSEWNNDLSEDSSIDVSFYRLKRKTEI